MLVSIYSVHKVDSSTAGIALTRREMELLLAEMELATGGQTGQAAWISKGLKVEETQYIGLPSASRLN